MPLTRRQFLTRTGLTAAGALFAPGFLRNPFVQRALANTIGDRYFVSLYLDGGNDGLDTIIPAADAGGGHLLRTWYEAARLDGVGGQRVPVGSLLTPTSLVDPQSGTQLGFHPGLAGIRDLYDQGMVGVFQGVGYPEANLSHDVSTNIWETSAPLGVQGTEGWLGAHLADCFTPLEVPAVAITSGVPGEYRTTGTGILAVRRLRDFVFPLPFHNGYQDEDEAAVEAAFQALAGSASGSVQPLVRLVGDTGGVTQTATDNYRSLEDLYENDPARAVFDEAYGGLGTSMARDLNEVAKVMYGMVTGQPGVSSRFFHVRNSGYDTHGDQGSNDPDGRHWQLHQEVGDAVKLFYQDLADMDPALPDKVCTIVWSEFSRRIFQNDNGTDHGTQGVSFVIGGNIKGGVYGNHPNIEEAALDRGNTIYSQAAGDPFRSLDFRDLYGAILRDFMNVVDPHQFVGATDGNADPDHYWNTADFDVGTAGGIFNT